MSYCPKKSRKCKRNCGGRCDDCRSHRDDCPAVRRENDCCGCPTGPRGRPGPTGPGSTVPGPTGGSSTIPGPTGPGSTVPGPTGPGSTVPGPTGPGSIGGGALLPFGAITALLIPALSTFNLPPGEGVISASDLLGLTPVGSPVARAGEVTGFAARLSAAVPLDGSVTLQIYRTLAGAAVGTAAPIGTAITLTAGEFDDAVTFAGVAVAAGDFLQVRVSTAEFLALGLAIDTTVAIT